MMMMMERNVSIHHINPYVFVTHSPEANKANYSTTDIEPFPATLLLTISLPASYPTTAPSLSLTLPPSSPHPLPYLSLPTPDGPHLLTLLSPTITENLGTAMIYTLLLTLKDLTEGLILERATAVQEARDREKRMREEEEMRKFEGEKVSAGVFERWRAGFRREMMEEEEEGKRREEEKSGGKGGKREGGEGRRLTGREMWEKGLVGREEEAEEEGEGEGEVEDGERVVRGVEGLRV